MNTMENYEKILFILLNSNSALFICIPKLKFFIKHDVIQSLCFKENTINNT